MNLSRFLVVAVISWGLVFSIFANKTFAGAAPPTSMKGDAVSGRKIFLTFCFGCHGREGKGDGPISVRLDPKPRNLTNDQFMSSKSDQDLFNSISGGGAAFHGSMYMQPWMLSLEPQQIWDVVAYIRTLHRKPDVTGNAEKGKEIFAKYCVGCHGSGGKGDGPISAALGPKPRDLTDRSYMTTLLDLDLYFAISSGGKAVGRSESMPPWGGVLLEQEIWDLIAYVRSLHQK
ncbi:MAG: c-type cytochrome [Candidatus Tectomicrobia bacterium]|nr:c-type cytochrome [Candidatus Tectomicrobia bacterium]